MSERLSRVALEAEGRRREREIQLLINIVAPDPQYQPWYLSDNARLIDVRELNDEIVVPRLEGYFGRPFKGDISQPLWKLVDEIKELYPGWPDEWE